MPLLIFYVWLRNKYANALILMPLLALMSEEIIIKKGNYQIATIFQLEPVVKKLGYNSKERGGFESGTRARRKLVPRPL